MRWLVKGWVYRYRRNKRRWGKRERERERQKGSWKSMDHRSIYFIWAEFGSRNFDVMLCDAIQSMQIDPTFNFDLLCFESICSHPISTYHILSPSTIHLSIYLHLYINLYIYAYHTRPPNPTPDKIISQKMPLSLHQQERKQRASSKNMIKALVKLTSGVSKGQGEHHIIIYITYCI